MAKTERTLLFVKPDAVKRGLVGEVVRRVEKSGLKIVDLKMVRLSRKQGEDLYSVHRGKPFHADLVDYILSGPIVAMVLEGEGAIRVVRGMIGATDPKEAKQGTIRHDLGLGIMKNVVHASDSPESARYEIPIIFGSET
ncbi:MAG: nucleoside-diphosphate kinase [Candidatus Bathyarchaeia archaeon]